MIGKITSNCYNNICVYSINNVHEKLLEIGKEKQIRKPNFVLSIVDKTKTHNTREEIAKELGWGNGKVARADVVSKNATAETKGHRSKLLTS